MSFLNPWLFFALIPLYLFYRQHKNISRQSQALFIVLILLLMAMARPVIKESYTPQTFDAHDFIIAIDASYSMQADDLKPSRYILAKEAIKELIHKRVKDRFTLFAFTSSVLLISPPTTDTDISLLALDALEPKYILTKSTNLQNLFKSVAKLPMKQKNLILFTDGGDEKDIVKLAKIATKNHIKPFIVATATQRGAALKKERKYIKNIHGAIVISKINPMLKDLANATNGRYYELSASHDISKLLDDLHTKESKKEKITVKNYRELFWLPLLFAALLFIASVTQLKKKFFALFSFVLLFAQNGDASVLDFYHIHTATKSYKIKHYLQAAKEFKKIDASTRSYYNIATAYYKAGAYKFAAQYYKKIRTKDASLKQKILYNLGNTTVKLKAYTRARRYYIEALSLGDNADALYNLQLLQKLHLQSVKQPSKTIPQSQNKRKKNDAKGSGKKKKSKKEQTKKKDYQKKKKKGIYKFTYKAYEKINKGYTDEKEPW